MEDNQKLSVGLSLFSMTIEKRISKIFLSGTFDSGNGRLSHFWNPKQIEVTPEEALASLVSSWAQIAGPFYKNGEASGEYHLSCLIDSTRSGPIIKREDVYSSLCFNDETVELDSHSVIPIEVLIRIGNLLSEECQSDDLRKDWNERVANTYLSQFPAWDHKNVDLSYLTDDFESDTDWNAKQLGQDPARYREAAVWLHSKQLLYGLKNEGEDLKATVWNSSVLPEGLPTSEEINDLKTRAVEAYNAVMPGMTDENFVREALTTRNSDARNRVIYRRWYDDRARPLAP